MYFKRRGKKMNLINTTLITILGFTLLIGCTKPRSKKDDQFADPNVVGKSISNYDNQIFHLTTGKVRYEVSRSSADTFINETESNSFVDYPVVDYTVNYAKGMPNLLGENVRFRGIPGGHKYEIRTTIVHDKLWVNKVGSRNEIPTDELTLATQLDDNRYMVPLVSYDVSFFRRELVKNADNEDSNIFGYVPVLPEDRELATHIHINEMSGVLTEPLTKTDSFKVNFFDGEWFYARTVVEAQNNSGHVWQVGTSRSGLDSNLRPATRVKFLKTANSLQVVNVNVDERLLSEKNSTDNELEFDQVMSIPAELFDYRQVVNDKGILQPEEEKHSERKVQDREWIKLEFENAFTLNDIFATQLASLFEGSRKLTDLRVADDFWSFTVLAKDSGAKIRYSFYKVDKALDKDYHPRNFIVDDRDYFGLFATQKSFIRNYEQYTEEDLEKYLFLQRFNPKNKVIEFHMSHGMAQSKIAKELAKEALSYWDKAFELAGTGITVRLNQEKTVDLGDLRYNVLNIIDRVASGNLNNGGLLFGVGPSISDPKTGQIVSVSNTLHVDSFRDIAVRDIRNYILDKVGALKRVQNDVIQNFSSPVPARTTYQISPELAMISQMLDPNTQKMVPTEIPVNSSFNPRGIEMHKIEFDTDRLDPLSKYYLEKMSGIPINSMSDYVNAYRTYGKQLVTSGLLMSKRSELNDFLNTENRNSYQKIRTRCPEITEFAEALTEIPKDSSQSNPLVLSCANKIIKDLALSTLVHELGHNFGLAHNFSSSNDKENFWTPTEVENVYGLNLEERNLNADSLSTASIMEYMPSNRDQMIVPGKYDIAALRYAYTGQIVRKSSGLPERIPDLNKSLEENFGRQLKDIQTFRYCDDFDADVKHDPLCLRQDFGITPEEIARNLIAEYYESLIYGSYRYGRDQLSPGIFKGASRMTRVLVPLRRFYDEWRFHLADFMADGNLYLSQVSEEKLHETILAMQESDKYNDIYQKWYPAREIITQFFLDIVTLPNHYCLGITDNNQVVPVELDEVIDQIKRFNTSEEVISCNDDVVKATLKSKYHANYILEFGFSPEDRWFSLRAKDENRPLDYSGVRMDKVFAEIVMGLRAPISISHTNRGFFPNMFDEPGYRALVGQTLISRVTKGADLSRGIIMRLQQLLKERTPGIQEFSISEMMESDKLTGEEKNLLNAVVLQLKNSTNGQPNVQPELRFKKYKRESEIALEQYKNFVMAQIVPGEQYESRIRLSPFRASETSDPSYLNQQGLLKARLPNGSYITAFPDQNPVAAYLIESFSNVSTKLGLVHLSPKDFDTAAKRIEELKHLLPKGETDLFTIESLATLLETTDLGLAAVLQSQNLTPGARNIIQTVFEVEIGIYSGQLGQSLSQFRQSLQQTKSEEVEKKYREFISQDLSKDYAQNGIKIPTLKTLKGRLESLRLNSSEAIENQDEFEAKRDLLLRILTE